LHLAKSSVISATIDGEASIFLVGDNIDDGRSEEDGYFMVETIH
jgi:hypothetical protein